MQDDWNQKKDGTGDAPDEEAQRNGCTYHGKPAASDDSETSTQSPYETTEDDQEQQPNEPTGNGYARPYSQDQYPYGQQNRQYGVGGQPPMGGGTYPYGSSAAPDSRKKRNLGLIVLIVLLCITVAVAAIGIIFSFVRQDGGNGNTEGLAIPEENVTNSDGPSLNLAEPPANLNTPSDDETMTPQEVYQKIKESSVGVLQYSKSTRQLASEGSGVIMGEDSEGKYTYIVTCAHVINADDSSFTVMLSDETTHSAQVVGYDTRTDIGVLRIEASGLQKAEFGDVSSLEVGQTVYAIGNPGGSEFAGSFTNGMISAISRPVSSSTGYTTKCIQHTAAINPGNSGGALVNAFGQVIGINSMKIVETEYEGMGFAVPSDIVQEIVNDLILNGYVPDRAKLGITYRPASAYELYSMVIQLRDLPKGSLVIESISTDSDLANTDAQNGDMIVAVNGIDLDDSDTLPSLIERSSQGDQLTLSLVRINEDYSLSEFDVTVKLVADLGSAAPETSIPETTVADDPFSYFPFR